MDGQVDGFTCGCLEDSRWKGGRARETERGDPPADVFVQQAPGGRGALARSRHPLDALPTAGGDGGEVAKRGQQQGEEGEGDGGLREGTAGVGWARWTVES